MTEVDAVVVGSGPNGLVAAVMLAEAGWKVVVLEAADTPGGGTRTEELTLPGFRHDVCSAVHPMALASPAFQELRLERDGLELAQPPIPLAHPLAPGYSAYLRRDVAQTASGLGRDRRYWETVVGGLASRWERMVAGVLDPTALPPNAPLVTLGFGVAGVWPATLVTRVLRDQPAKALLAGLAGHTFLNLGEPMTTGMGMLLGVLGHAVGWPVAVGGSQSIADALVRRLASLGGEVVTGHRVTTVDALPTARAVVLDLTPRQVLAVAGHRLPAAYTNRLARWTYGPGVFKVDWALDGPVPWTDAELAGAGTVHLAGPAAKVIAAERTVARGGLPDEPFVLFSQPCVADPSRAPAGKHTAWAYCHVPNGSDADMTAAIEAQVEKFAPGFRDRVLARHVMGTAAMEAHNPNNVGGSVDGGSSPGRPRAARPPLRRTPWATPDPSLCRGSASTRPGGGVHGMGGRQAARTVLARLG